MALRDRRKDMLNCGVAINDERFPEVGKMFRKLNHLSMWRLKLFEFCVICDKSRYKNVDIKNDIAHFL